jgi:hypothetical protein
MPMDDYTIELSWTGHFREFKENLGNSNHYLITILIGLEGVRTKKVTKDDSFNVNWNPADLESSVGGSRKFARKAALAWTIDALDGYLGFLRKDFFDFGDPEFVAKIRNKDSRSIYKSLNDVTEFCQYTLDLPLSLVQLGIQWRNNLVHYHADNDLDPKYRDFIRRADPIETSKRFSGLEPIMMLEDFEQGIPPKHKAIACIIRSTHYLVQALDPILVRYVNLKRYTDHLVKTYEKEFRQVISASPELRIKKARQFFISRGFKPSVNVGSPLTLNSIDLQELVNSYRLSQFNKKES